MYRSALPVGTQPALKSTRPRTRATRRRTGQRSQGPIAPSSEYGERGCRSIRVVQRRQEWRRRRVRKRWRGATPEQPMQRGRPRSGHDVYNLRVNWGRSRGRNVPMGLQLDQDEVCGRCLADVRDFELEPSNAAQILWLEAELLASKPRFGRN